MAASFLEPVLPPNTPSKTGWMAIRATAIFLRVAHECSSVTAACLVTRRQDYLDVGGMDEVLFPVNFNDVDYCLKLRARGQSIVFTPHAKLLHLESAAAALDLALDRKARLDRELRNLRSKWGGCWRQTPITVRCSRAIQYRIRHWRGLPVLWSRVSTSLRSPQRCRWDFDRSPGPDGARIRHSEKLSGAPKQQSQPASAFAALRKRSTKSVSVRISP